MPQKAKPIECSKSVIENLEDLASSTSNPRLAKRAAIVLECVKGTPGNEVARMFGEREATVSKWKHRFQNYGVSGLANLPRGKPAGMYGPPFQERLQKTILGPPPAGESYWTAKLLSAALDVPLYIVTRYLRKSNIHLLEYRRSVKGEVPTGNPGERVSNIADAPPEINEDESSPSREDGEEILADSKNTTSELDSSIFEKSMRVSITACGQAHDAANQTLDVQMIVRLMEGDNCIRESCCELPNVIPKLEYIDVKFDDTS